MNDPIEILLNQKLGLDVESIGSSTIARAVQERMAVCQLSDAQVYWERLASSDTELQHLIELVVVPETWFFRDSEAFATLAQFATSEWLPAHPLGTMRLLSLPCSTGEEAYSMAMALLDAGLPANSFAIDAVDVSVRALARAKEAVYGKNSFRSRDLNFRDRYFKETSAGFRLDETVCQQVRFHPGNLIDAHFLPGHEIYDVIFCRNLLIYLDQTTQDRAIKVLLRLLKPQGLVFMGPSETALLTGHNFVSMKVPLAFAYRKIKTPARTAKKNTQSATVRQVVAQPVTVPVPPVVAHRAPAPPVPPPPVAIDLDEALRLADQGHLAEATKQCGEFLKAHGPSAKAFYILGLIRDSAGEPQVAIQYYRKALYLEPNHHSALLHLALLLDKQGDKAGAKLLNDRAARLEQKGAN